jgi:hypothetical protein
MAGADRFRLWRCAPLRGGMECRCKAFRSRPLQQEIEPSERHIPVLRLGMPESRVDYLEAASEREAQTANHGGHLRRSVIAISQVEDRELRETCRIGSSSTLSSKRRSAWMFSCSPLVIGRSKGSITSRALAFAFAWGA